MLHVLVEIKKRSGNKVCSLPVFVRNTACTTTLGHFKGFTYNCFSARGYSNFNIDNTIFFTYIYVTGVKSIEE